MGFRSGAAVAAVLALAVTLAIPGVAGIRSSSSKPVYQPPQAYYLALGDSITFGFQPTKPVASAPSAFDTGYVDVVAARLRKLAPTIQTVNYGCPGESTVTFVRGGCPWLAEHRKLHDPFRGSQLNAAVSFLRAHPADVSPITLTLWGNDWFAVELDRCQAKLPCIRQRAAATIAFIGSRLTSILRRLRTAAPTAEIIVMGAINFEVDRLQQMQGFYRSIEGAIARAAATTSSRVANTLAVFNAGDAQAQKARICRFLFICSKGDPHPTDAGYRAIADAVMAASGYPRK